MSTNAMSTADQPVDLGSLVPHAESCGCITRRIADGSFHSIGWLCRQHRETAR